eukprot:1138334-Pelagomonas_calceolata.AAC.2
MQAMKALPISIMEKMTPRSKAPCIPSTKRKKDSMTSGGRDASSTACSSFYRGRLSRICMDLIFSSDKIFSYDLADKINTLDWPPFIPSVILSALHIQLKALARTKAECCILSVNRGALCKADVLLHSDLQSYFLSTLKGLMEETQPWYQAVRRLPTSIQEKETELVLKKKGKNIMMRAVRTHLTFNGLRRFRKRRHIGSKSGELLIHHCSGRSWYKKYRVIGGKEGLQSKRLTASLFIKDKKFM